MFHLNSKRKTNKQKKNPNDLIKKKQEVVPTRRGEKKRKTMSDMSSIQKSSHLVFQDVLGLSSLVFPLEMSQAVYEGRQQLDIHILHTETDEEGGA